MCPRWPSKAKPPRLKDAESSFETGRVLPSPPAPCLPQLPQAAGKGAAEGRVKLVLYHPLAASGLEPEE